MQPLRVIANTLLEMDEEGEEFILALEGLRAQALKAQDIAMVEAHKELFYLAMAACTEADNSLSEVRRIRLGTNRMWRNMETLLKRNPETLSNSPQIALWSQALERYRQRLDMQKQATEAIKRSIKTIALFSCCNEVIWSAASGWESPKP